MRTAIFVYQTTTLDILTNENDLQLCHMNNESVSLCHGPNAPTIAPGIYKIVSCQDIRVTGDAAAFDIIVTTNSKDNIPPLPPKVTAQTFGQLDVFALQTFFAVADAKVFSNP